MSLGSLLRILLQQQRLFIGKIRKVPGIQMSGLAMVSGMIEAFNGIKDRIESKISRKFRSIDTELLIENVNIGQNRPLTA